MKNNYFLIICFLLSFGVTKISLAQEFKNIPSIGVLYINSKGFNLDGIQMGDLVRVELDKIEKFQVMDRYDMEYIIEKNNLQTEKCFGKLCLTELGKQLKVDKMLSGSVEVFGERITITMRLIDVHSSMVEKTQVMDFLNLKNHVQSMLGITIQKMFDSPIDEKLYTKLSKKFDYENTINTPHSERLNLSGPRMGLVFITGENARIFKDPESVGGLDAYPLMFQFGYQFELKYLNQGDFQALVEFIPVITGLDQGKFLPSIALLNGFRSNRTGWEFAFGPVFYGVKTADGYYDDKDEWHLEKTWANENPGEPNPYEVVNRIDSRGDFSFDSGFLFGLGKTFKSGRLNIPINAFFVPNRQGHRFGLSLGFNAHTYRK